MSNQESLTEEQTDKMSKLIKENNRDVPLFYDEGVCEVKYVPVDGAELRVFHHKPKNPITKRPILFISGFGTSPWSWRHFNTPMYEKGEYYFLETREKTSSKVFTGRLRTNMTIDQNAKDLAEAIKYLELDNTDFVLYGTSYCGAIALTGLANEYLSAPTVAVHDPLSDWKVQRRMTLMIGLLPIFVINALKMLIVRVILLRMKNKSAKERYIDFIRNATVWKWRRSGWHNFSFKIAKYLSLINNEILVFHGTKDRYHSDEDFLNLAKDMPNSRYIYMDSPNEYRELIVGIQALELGKITSEDKLPKELSQFEIKMER